ncbi:MAG: NAD(P)/FAD-dependent oxidoreductase [Alphaproteobacteria bacterium]|nr:MAG: NAD(P)/FAD-dependent oxidoreductase [Alphaproteobacteria bacterium]
MSQNSPEIAIIGAGPVGLFSVYANGMMGYRSYLFDFQEELGGQCVLYKDKPIYDIPAYPKITAEKLVRKLKKQHKPFRPEYRLKEQVLDIQKTDDGFTLTTDKDTVNVKAVVIAGGIGAFGPRKPPLSNIEEFEDKSVFYHVSDKSMFKDKNIVIAGGGDSAVDWALELSKIAGQVYLVHRRTKFRCHDSSEQALDKLIESGKVILKAPGQVKALHGNDGVLTQVDVQNIQDDSIDAIKADFFLPFFGLSADLGPILKWDLDLKKDMIPVDVTTMRSPKEGIYAIGDIAHYDNKQKLIAIGFTEAFTAAHNIRAYLNPGKVFHFEYSTTKGVKEL